MTINKFKLFAEERGWTISKERAYGELEGFKITLVNMQGSMVFMIPLISLDDVRKQEIIHYLEQCSKALKLKEFFFNSMNILYLKLTEDSNGGLDDTNVEDMYYLIKKVTEFLNAISFENKNYCVICGKGNAFEKTFINEIYHSAHRECLPNSTLQYDHSPLQYHDYHAESKNYLSGTVGAFFGALIGSVPFILVQAYLNRIAFLAAFLIAYSSLLGYSLLKGKPGPATKWIIGCNTILSVFLSQAAVVYIHLTQADIPVNSATIKLIFSLDKVSGSLKYNLFLSLLVGIVGIISLFARTNDTARA